MNNIKKEIEGAKDDINWLLQNFDLNYDWLSAFDSATLSLHDNFIRLCHEKSITETRKIWKKVPVEHDRGFGRKVIQTA